LLSPASSGAVGAQGGNLYPLKLNGAVAEAGDDRPAFDDDGDK
jgi:hypothetical protein